MKWAAISLNLLLPVTLVFLLAAKGAPEGKELFLLILWFAAPISTLLVLFLTGAESRIDFYFKRKALEEKR